VVDDPLVDGSGLQVRLLRVLVAFRVDDFRRLSWLVPRAGLGVDLTRRLHEVLQQLVALLHRQELHIYELSTPSA
jgi:hypothetical protein